MPLFDYKCDSCNVIIEYSTNASLPKDMRPPEDMICPTCKGGKLEKQLSVTGQIHDCPGGYDYIYGKKAWKKHLSLADQAKVLTGEKNPY